MKTIDVLLISISSYSRRIFATSVRLFWQHNPNGVKL